MEGRAIARPNLRYSDSPGNDSNPSMEGRAIARPNPAGGGGVARAQLAPSMEGRAIARPNLYRGCSMQETRFLQWRAGQLPGQTIVRRSSKSFVTFLQWRAGQLPGQTELPSPGCPGRDALQWRAGQLPGQTSLKGPIVVVTTIPFNGGPGNCPAKRGRVVGQHPASSSFNGGPGNCPAKPETSRRREARLFPFNGGPGNCPAKHPTNNKRRNQMSLQWRAGQLPGQTRGRSTANPGDSASLQWRAGQLPGQTSGLRPFGRRSGTAFNGGPGNCPAKPRQVPGIQYRLGRPCAFNGGPGNCPAKPLAQSGVLDLPVRGRLRAVVEVGASKVLRFCCQAANCLVFNGVERSPRIAWSP